MLLQKKNAKIDKYLQVALGFSKKCDKTHLNDKMGESICYNFPQCCKYSQMDLKIIKLHELKSSLKMPVGIEA